MREHSSKQRSLAATYVRTTMKAPCIISIKTTAAQKIFLRSPLVQDYRCSRSFLRFPLPRSRPAAAVAHAARRSLSIRSVTMVPSFNQSNEIAPPRRLDIL